MNTHKTTKSIIAFGMLVAGCASLVSNQSTSALTYQGAADVSFTINSSLSVSLSSGDLVIYGLAPGAVSDSNTITVTVDTNAAYGYVLNATVGQPTNYETRNLILANSDANFASVAYGSNLASITADNTWGFSYKTSDSGAAWSNYSGLPRYDDTTNVTTLLSTNTAAAGESIDFKIAARAASTQPGGEYKNVINFVAVANPEPELEPVACSSGRICYNVNSLGPTEGTMGEQSASANSSVELLASNFSRTGYGFAGWSDAYDYATNSSAHFYGPQETITTPSNMSNGLPLYAVWVKSAGYFQNSGTVSSVCRSLTVAPTNGTANLSSVSALTDQRDNQTYAIAKLADGNCWMIENLRLESTNTDNSTGTLAQGYGGQFAGLANAEPAWADESTTANSLYSTDGADGTINIGTTNVANRFPRYNNVNTPTTASDRPQNPTFNSASMYSYGNYYTWPAAIADTTEYTSGDHNTTSICPTGWKIPLGNTSTGNIGQGASDPANKVPGFSYLDRKMGGTGASQSTAADSLRWRKFPVNFVYSGYVGGGSVNGRGFYGYFWSSTANNSISAYNLYLFSSYINSGTTYILKYLGRTVRCVAPGV